MEPLLTAEGSRAADRALAEGAGLGGLVLMETASRGLAEAIRRHHAAEASRGVVVVCGPGQNGGDGYGCARWLASWGFDVRVLSTADRSGGDAAVMRRACARLGVPGTEDLGEAGLLVDALFGTGLSRPVEGPFAALVEAMDAHPAPVVAADLPSGVDADTGTLRGPPLRAVRTVTFGARKPGHHAADGLRLSGVVDVVDLGFGGLALDPPAERPDAADLAPRWPVRAPQDHKTRSGRLLVIAGSTAMAGAAVLACRGALAAGAGLVTLRIPRGALARLGALPPEVMVELEGDGDVLEGLGPVEGFDALAVGPGLGGGRPLSRGLMGALVGLWARARQPAVFDADALGAASGLPGGPRVITPHPGEAGRLLGGGAAAVEEDRFGAAAALARPGVVALLKGPATLVATPDHPTSVNPTGAATLATGGSGDVLTGVIGALLARGVRARDAARLGAWVHGRAGERLAEAAAEGWTAGDIAAALPAAVADLGSAARFPCAAAARGEGEA